MHFLAWEKLPGILKSAQTGNQTGELRIYTALVCFMHLITFCKVNLKDPKKRKIKKALIYRKCLLKFSALGLAFIAAMQTNWPALLSMAVFYLIVLITGIWASRKSRREEKRCASSRSEVAMVGGRNLNLVVSIFTLTGTPWRHDECLTGCSVERKWQIETRSPLFNKAHDIKPIKGAGWEDLALILQWANVLQPRGSAAASFWPLQKWSTVQPKAWSGLWHQYPASSIWS